MYFYILFIVTSVLIFYYLITRHLSGIVSNLVQKMSETQQNKTWFGYLFKIFKSLFGIASPKPIEYKKEEEYLQMTLSRELINELQQEFGVVSSHVSDLKVAVPSHLAQELYVSYLEVLLQNEEDYLEELSALKEETEGFARALNEKGAEFYIDEDWESESLALTEDLDLVDSSTTGFLYRQKAQEHTRSSRLFYQRAQACFKSNRFAEAHEYLQQSRQEIRLADEANNLAVQVILAANSTGLPSHVLDLHYLHVEEAVLVLSRYLNANILQLKRDGLALKTVMIVTGRGKHSPHGIPKIKPAVEAQLLSRRLRFSEANPGSLRVEIRMDSLVVGGKQR